MNPPLCFTCLFLPGEVAKQMKVKKLKNLKTLDSKPGKDSSLLELPADLIPASVNWSQCVFITGVYTAYKPYLSKDEEIIKQLQKVAGRLSWLPGACCCMFLKQPGLKEL